MGGAVLEETSSMYITTMRKMDLGVCIFFFLKGYIAPLLEKPVRDTTQLIAYHAPEDRLHPPYSRGWE